MACMATDKSSGPLLPPQINQKRCSLPGPTGSLNLYATHQQRRLSERGLMIYRPSKPDIDLIGDFLNPSKHKSQSTSASTSGNIATSTALPTIPSPSKSSSQQSSPNTSFSSAGNGNDNGNGSNAAASFILNPVPTTNASQQLDSGGRKVILKIQKNNRTKEKFVEIGYSPNSPMSLFSSKALTNNPDENSPLLCKPASADSRRFSDSIATRAPPKINVTMPDPEAGIICTTGDLLTLKCLTSSAQEIRYYSSPYGSYGSTPTEEDRTGNRSRSFDATYSTTMPRKCAGSSWFNRRHLPISVKLPLPVKSPSIPNSPGPTQSKFKAPILTVTNENTGSSELIEIPSPPAGTPTSPSSDAQEEKTKVTWDKSGFVLDASVLGFAIENHLRQIDMGRRATFSTLYQAGNSDNDESPSPMRTRSASACVIPSQVNSSQMFPTNWTGDRSIFSSLGSNNGNANGPNNNSNAKTTNNTSNRRMSLASNMTGCTSPTTRFTLPSESRQTFQRTLLSQPTSTSGNKPDKLSHGGGNNGSASGCSRGRSQSYVETVDTKGKSSMTKTTTQGSFLSNRSSASGSRLFNQLNQNEKANQDESNKASFRKSLSSSQANSGNQNSNAAGSGQGLSICSAIRDFIYHSLKS